MNIQFNKSLRELNTFGIEVKASEFIAAHNDTELIEILNFANNNNKKIKVIGGGSNILLTKEVECLIILNRLKGINIVAETADHADVQFKSGENWHQCVLFCIEKNLGGIENLSLIPGSIGAAPIQNIGAYGVELKDVFVQLEAVHTQTLQSRVFNLHDCAFGYRDSVFKHAAHQHYFITSVTLRLQKKPVFNIEYGDIKKVLQEDYQNEITLKNISDAVIKIRTSKLPDPKVIGNAGSFFKNPVVEIELAATLKLSYPHMPSFDTETGVKIPAAWLIEQCNWKGHVAGNYGVHSKQPLVLVNYGGAKGSDILQLSDSIITSVQQRFNITLEREVNIW